MLRQEEEKKKTWRERRTEATSGEQLQRLPSSIYNNPRLETW